MANVVETNEGSGENDLDQFIKENNLENARPKLLKLGVTFQDLVDLSSRPRKKLQLKN